MRCLAIIILVVGGWASIPSHAPAQSHEEQTVNEATQTLREILDVPLKGIPEALLRDAQAIAIIPGMVKGGFIVGVRHGKGVLVTRENGAWRAPVFITLTGGSVGWQAGLQATDLVLVFKTRHSVDGILRGRLTIGADVSVAAGPVGRQASAGTDAQLKAEILSYSRSRGLFAGLAVDGAVLHVDHRANSEYYTPRPGQPQGTIPASAGALVQLIAASASPVRPAPMAVPAPKEVPPPPALPVPDERETVRQQLVLAAQRLQPLLDQGWQQYLALPPEIFTGQAFANGTTLEPYVRRYQAIASDPRYRVLYERMEFQEAHALLRRYAALLQPRPAGSLNLPPPPIK